MSSAAVDPDQQASSPSSRSAQTLDETRYHKYAIAYSSATTSTGWMNYYFWLEAFAWSYFLVLGLIIMFGSIDCLQIMRIGLWYGLKGMFAASFVSVIFFVGPPPYNLKQVQLMRHKFHMVYALITGILCIVSGIAFMVIQLVYVFSDTCNNDPNSVCSGSMALFIFLMLMCSGLVAIEGLSVATVLSSWHSKRDV
jgi:hypothetical protein